MTWTNLPNGLSLTTTTGAVDGTLVATSVSAAALVSSGPITGAAGSVYGARVPVVNVGAGAGSAFFAATSALNDSPTTVLAPCSGYAEIILIQGGTGTVDQVVTVYADSVTTGTAIATLNEVAAGVTAGGIYSTIGTTVCTQGSFIILSHAAAATANSSMVLLNIVEAV